MRGGPSQEHAGGRQCKVCLPSNAYLGFSLILAPLAAGQPFLDLSLPSALLPVFFHAVFVKLLNNFSDWTDQFDSGCKVDEHAVGLPTVKVGKSVAPLFVLRTQSSRSQNRVCNKMFKQGIIACVYV